MPVAAIDQLVTDVKAEDDVIDSAVLLINGFKARLDAAVADALKGGATAAELAPLTALSSDIGSKTKALSDAVAANTPAATP
jgi:hypothetical protein